MPATSTKESAAPQTCETHPEKPACCSTDVHELDAENAKLEYAAVVTELDALYARHSALIYRQAELTVHLGDCLKAEFEVSL